MRTQRYTWPAMALHWVQAAIVLWLLWLGWTMTDLPKGAERSAAYGLHKSLGLLMLLMVIVRLAWHRRRRTPPQAVDGWEGHLVRGTHHSLYIFLVLAPIAGYLASSFTPYALKFFGYEIAKFGWPDESINGLFKALHETAVWGGAGLIVLHLAGAIKHAIKDDGILQRMLPSRASEN